MKTWVKPGLETLAMSTTTDNPALKSIIATDEDVSTPSIAITATPTNETATNESPTVSPAPSDDSGTKSAEANKDPVIEQTDTEQTVSELDGQEKETLKEREDSNMTENGQKDEQFATEEDCSLTETEKPITDDNTITDLESSSIFAEKATIFSESDESFYGEQELQFGGSCSDFTEDEDLNNKLMKLLNES